MKFYGLSTISEFLGDNIAYRSLNPLDTLPQLKSTRYSPAFPK